MVALSLRDEKEYLHEQLREVRSVMLWKLDGLTERDRRRPMTPTGTNLLGLVKHLTGMEASYLGETFGRPFDQPLPWYDDGGGWQNADMWATPEESTDYIVGLYRDACRNADRTIDQLDLDAHGTTPHAGETTNLRFCLIGMIVETARHAGHADITRELIDGSVGAAPDELSLPPDVDAQWWRTYKANVTNAADAAAHDFG